MSGRRKLYIIAFTVVTASALPARGDFTYDNFSSTNGLRLNGDTTVVANELQLTTAAPFSSGSVFTTSPVALGNINTFSTYFRFRITNSGGIGDEDGPGADGLAFVVQTVSNSVGVAGGGIGYTGIAPSLGIEFDTFNNGSGFGDPNGNHVGVDLNGDIVSVATATEPTRFNNGEIWNVWIDYDGTVGRVAVRWSMENLRPTAPGLTATVDLQQILGANSAFVGFTSATGSGWGDHDILSWEYRQTLGAGTVPEPSSLILLATGGMWAFLYYNRRRRG